MIKKKNILRYDALSMLSYWYLLFLMILIRDNFLNIWDSFLFNEIIYIMAKNMIYYMRTLIILSYCNSKYLSKADSTIAYVVVSDYRK